MFIYFDGMEHLFKWEPTKKTFVQVGILFNKFTGFSKKNGYHFDGV